MKTDGPHENETEGDVLVQPKRSEVKEPPRFGVFLLNDEFCGRDSSAVFQEIRSGCGTNYAAGTSTGERTCRGLPS
jgi:hypothetical protein